jgi:hypothetical protein
VEAEMQLMKAVRDMGIALPETSFSLLPFSGNVATSNYIDGLFSGNNALFLQENEDSANLPEKTEMSVEEKRLSIIEF